MFAPDRYVAALRFAAERHRTQTITGSDLPYLVHVTSVAAEVIAALPGTTLDADLAVMCALLHDTIEDTAKTPDDKLTLAREIANRFGAPVRDGVLALSKEKRADDGSEIPKVDQMADSLRRIRDQPPAVWAVKLADRITNLAPPPTQWSKDKCAAYRIEAQMILEALGEANATLAARLRARIESYVQYCS
jgi:(p)ppGpp synthase/HD superfamily hydrolase